MYKIQNENYKSRIKKYLSRQHFMNYVGFRLDVIEPGKTEGWLDVLKVHKQQKGLLHGGVVATLADIVAGFAAFTLVPVTHHVVTGEMKISYLRPGTSNRIYAKGWVLKPGKKLIFCEAEIWDGDHDSGKLIAKATTTMVAIPPGEIAAIDNG